MGLENKCVFITGASSGFGEACAKQFRAAGARLVIAARTLSKLKQFQKEMPQEQCYALELDMHDKQAIKALPDSLPPEFQKIDILVNNAGLALGLEGAWAADVEQWDEMIDTNCRGLVHLTRAILPGMVERNCGHIVNIGSVAGNWPYPGGNVYGASKAFVQQFSRNLRCDLLGKKIRVSNIEPGMANTQFSSVRFSGNEERAEKVYEGTTPLSARDVAETVVWSTSLPEHVNINTLELMATCQAWSPFAVDRSMQYES